MLGLYTEPRLQVRRAPGLGAVYSRNGCDSGLATFQRVGMLLVYVMLYCESMCTCAVH